MLKHEIKCLFPKDINEKKDVFLGETSVQITGTCGYPSVHLVKSYMLSTGQEADRAEGSHYHIFEFKCGTAATHYRQKEFEQVRNFIELNHNWNVFFRNNNVNLLVPIPKENFLPCD